jgi:SAM-dependent methyltransferase
MRAREAYPPVLDLLGAQVGSTLLDVGCGLGFLLHAAQARGVRAFGVDLSDQAVRIARGVSPGARLAVCAGEHLTFRDASFDHVTCLGSLEHFLDLEQGLREMRRVAKQDARCVIMVPNRRFAGWWLLGRTGTAQQGIREQLLTLGEWQRLFTRHGFSVLAVLPDLWHADKWKLKRLPPVLAQLLPPLVLMVWRLIPLRFQYQFLFLLRRNAA